MTPMVSPTRRKPAKLAVPLAPTTWPAAYWTDTEPSGLKIIHQMVTACPASSPVVDSVKEIPLAVRVNVEVLATDPAKVVTGLVVWVAAPPR